ncbi:hypothetical protein PQI07_16440 [Methylobacterium sp. 092160098-2]|uniref:hypothetical protein n=1 Tax=Methylobacterium sp. 092160098-2 TaxID=3025129 RepID=UPI0023819EF4|nr:hypothetical protein [Methylobacterium sp. 092160098-2]MDE4912271.1 hypothetical protein [Methylobacterium sp. 092160098-2]
MRSAPEGPRGAPQDVVEVDMPADCSLACRGAQGIPQGVDDGRVELAGVGGAGVPEGLPLRPLTGAVGIATRRSRGRGRDKGGHGH